MFSKTDSAGQGITYRPPGQNGRHFADIVLGCIFVNEKFLYFDQNIIEVCSEVSNW